MSLALALLLLLVENGTCTLTSSVINGQLVQTAVCPILHPPPPREPPVRQGDPRRDREG